MRLLVLGVLSLHECRREPRAHGWTKGSERAPYYRGIVNFKIFNILHFTLAILMIAVATAQVNTKIKFAFPTIRENRGVFNLNI